MTIKRMAPADRRYQILRASMPLAEQSNYMAVTRDEVAQAAGVSGPLIHHLFGNVAGLRREMIRFAIKHEHYKVIGQGIMNRNPDAMNASRSLCHKSLQSLLT